MRGSVCVTTADSRKGFPDLNHPEGGTAHYQRSQGEADRVRVHITLVTVLRESGALVQGHIWHTSIASHRLEIVLR